MGIALPGGGDYWAWRSAQGAINGQGVSRKGRLLGIAPLARGDLWASKSRFSDEWAVRAISRRGHKTFISSVEAKRGGELQRGQRARFKARNTAPQMPLGFPNCPSPARAILSA